VMRSYASSSEDARAVYLAAGTNLLAVQPQVMLTPEILAKIVEQTAAAKAPDPAQLLGWYSYNLNQFTTAGQWFATALAWKPEDEMAAYGLALTRQRLGNVAGLKQLQAAWEGRSPRIAMVGGATALGMVPAGQPMAQQQMQPVQQTAQYVQPQIAQPQMVQPQTMPAPLTAQPAPLAMQPAAVQEMIAGQPIMLPAPLQQMQPVPQQTMPAQMAYAQVQPQPARYGAPAPRAQRAARPAQARAARPASSGCRVPVAPQTLAPQAALDRGWCLMELNRPLEAAPSFEVALQTGSAEMQQLAAYGQSLAFLRVGLNDKAAVSAARAPQPKARRIELSTALLSAQATTAFEAKRPVETLMALDQLAQLAPERLDLMVLRGYAYMDLRRFGDADRVFSAAAAAGSSAAQRGLNDLRLATGQLKSDG